METQVKKSFFVAQKELIKKNRLQFHLLATACGILTIALDFIEVPYDNLWLSLPLYIINSLSEGIFWALCIGFIIKFLVKEEPVEDGRKVNT